LTVGLKLLDIGNTANIRVRASASRVTENEFELSIDSWSDSQLYNAAATWIEFTESDNVYKGMSAPYELELAGTSRELR
jgi:hypothetical protein